MAAWRGDAAAFPPRDPRAILAPVTVSLPELHGTITPIPPRLDPELDRVPLADDDEPHQPYIPHTTELTELTPGAIVLGILLGLVFAASSVYLALKVGLTVSASIPIAVLSITIFRYASKAFGRQPASGGCVQTLLNTR